MIVLVNLLLLLNGNRMKKIIFLFLAVTMCIIIWQNRINIVIWSIPKILNVVRPISSEGNSDWQEGPIEKDSSDTRPNIILILADDLGFNDISFYNGGAGSGSLMTPNIDQIAFDGVIFENGYAANAMCAQSRASIMTGRYSTRFGFEFTPLFPGATKLMEWIINIEDPELKVEFKKEAYSKLENVLSAGVPSSEVTIAEVLSLIHI